MIEIAGLNLTLTGLIATLSQNRFVVVL